MSIIRVDVTLRTFTSECETTSSKLVEPSKLFFLSSPRSSSRKGTFLRRFVLCRRTRRKVIFIIISNYSKKRVVNISSLLGFAPASARVYFLAFLRSFNNNFETRVRERETFSWVIGGINDRRIQKALSREQNWSEIDLKIIIFAFFFESLSLPAIFPRWLLFWSLFFDFDSSSTSHSFDGSFGDLLLSRSAGNFVWRRILITWLNIPTGKIARRSSPPSPQPFRGRSRLSGDPNLHSGDESGAEKGCLKGAPRLGRELFSNRCL
jgi:hypothetical protein